MSNGTQVRVYHRRATPPDAVILEMPDARAELLFHDLNRLLSLLDTLAPNLQDGRDPDPGDQGAYDRTNEVLALMQRNLRIEPR